MIVPQLPPEEHPQVPHRIRVIRNLAAAVVERAVTDLTLMRGPEAPAIRRDAHDFLVRRLWDPECLWYEILHHALDYDRVVETVNRRCQVLSNGDVIPCEGESDE